MTEPTTDVELEESSRSPVALEVASPVGFAASQGTTIEQARAVAEAQAAVVLAQACPRDINRSRRLLKRSCTQPFVAERAFYKFNRGGQTIRDLTVMIARELAICWGNLEHGLTELARDDRAGVSEIKAWAWDQEANVRASSTFIVPHRRDRTIKRRGESDEHVQDTLSTLRDVQDNNASIGGRRLRQAIFAVIPEWFVEEARVELERTIRKGDGTPLPDRIAGAIAAFAELGVTEDRIALKLDRPSNHWTEFDIAELLVSRRSIARGELTADEEFPQPRVTADEIASLAAPKPEVGPPDADPDPPDEQEPSGDPQTEPADPDPAVAGSADTPEAREAAVRAALRKAKLRVPDALRAMSDHGHKFGTIGDLVADDAAHAALSAWIEEQER